MVAVSLKRLNPSWWKTPETSMANGSPKALEASGIEADDEGLYSWGSDAYSVAAAEARRRGVLDTSDCY